MGKLKEDLAAIPSWVWLGGAAAGALLFLITHLSGSSDASTAAADPLSSQVDAGTPTGAAAGTSDPLGQFLAEWQALQSMSTPAAGPAPTQPQPTTPADPTNQNPNNIGLPSAAYNPIPLTGGLLPTTSAPTVAGLDTAQQAIQNQLGVYGGAPVSTSTPYPDAGSTWAGVTQTTYAGGGQVTNLGIAQPRPAAGQVIPPAVQDQTIYGANGQVDWAATLAQAYQYPAGFVPGQVQH